MTASTITLLILAAAVIMFVTEVTPVGVTSLLVCTSLYLFGVLDVKEAYGSFADSNVILFGAMFVVGASLFETGIARMIGDKFVMTLGKQERHLIVGIMTLSAGLSVFLSNVSVVAMLLPVTIGVADAAKINRSRLLLPMSFAAATGGLISLVGTPPNMMINGYLVKAGIEPFSFFAFAWIGIPVTVLAILFMATIGMKFIPSRCAEPGVSEEGATSLSVGTKRDINKRNIYLTAVIFTVTVFAMIFNVQLKLPLHVSAFLGALALVVTRVMTDKQAYRSIDWNTIFLVAGMLPMATAMSKSGAGKMIAQMVINGLGQNASPYLITAAVFILLAVLTQFMSNVALTALMGPLAILMAQEMGVDPRAMILTVSLGASLAIATPIGTPSSALVYGPGNFKFTDYAKLGIPIIFIGLFVTVVILPLVFPF